MAFDRRAYNREYSRKRRLTAKYRATMKEYQKGWAERNREHLQHYKRRWRRSKRSNSSGVRHEAIMAGFKSGFERSLASNLSSRGIKFKYESTKIPYVLEREYNPDFHMVDHGFFIEAKGLLDRESKAKMAAVKRQHPELDIRFVFMQAQKRIPGTRQTHAQWAEKHGFLWAEGQAPEEWFVKR